MAGEGEEGGGVRLGGGGAARQRAADSGVRENDRQRKGKDTEQEAEKVPPT